MSYVNRQTLAAGRDFVRWLYGLDGLFKHPIQGIVIVSGVMVKRRKVLYVA